MAMRETMKQADYEHVKTLDNGMHVLRDIETGKLELWFSNKYHAGYGITYKNTHLEFASEYSKEVK